MNRAAISALTAAVLFGMSTPLAKLLVASVHPVMLAGMLYLGSGAGLAVVLLLRKRYCDTVAQTFSLPKGREVGWLVGAIAFGGIAGPVLLFFGLQSTAASTASLLLNLESAFTALFAWFMFGEHFDRRIALGMGLIVVGGLALSWSPSGALEMTTGLLLIVAACACWAMDNNLTRRVSANDAVAIACAKGLVAGTFNFLLALALGEALPGPSGVAAAAAIGFLGYGVSLVLFVIALRGLGTGRTGAYFSIAPFAGAVLGMLVNGDAFTVQLALAGLLMAAGVWLHLSERHEHVHEHPAQRHFHLHTHDVHHQHPHPPGVDLNLPHAHEHVHEPLTHAHAHFPDVDHRHQH
ncbi:MAG TPA: EamA family transporter [Casimicrobiaceae bacterium]|nr:EamA family transporter [Casimicrobiaceae bacterium]